MGKELRHSEAEVIELLQSVEKRYRQGELFGDYAELEEHYAKLVGLFRSINQQIQDISRPGSFRQVMMLRRLRKLRSRLIR